MNIMTGTINQIPQETPVLVTGATGFTGTALTVKLARPAHCP